MVPTEELPPRPPAAEPDTSTDAIPTESLPPVRATAAPTLSGAVPEQTINVGQTVTVDVTSHFAGIVQGWAVESSQLHERRGVDDRCRQSDRARTRRRYLDGHRHSGQ